MRKADNKGAYNKKDVREKQLAENIARANLYKNHVNILQTAYTELRTLTVTVVQESEEYADKIVGYLSHLKAENMDLIQNLTAADIGRIR